MYCLSLEFERSTKKWIGPSTRFYVHNFGRLRTHYQLKTPYRGSVPGPRWGPQTPSLLLCPPNNPVRSMPLHSGIDPRAMPGSQYIEHRPH